MVRISDIAAALAAKHHISQREAERFLTKMVDVMNDALRYDKQLKIKGLGTFKVSAISARESVNIHTGERIVIEGREKITFTPEAIMRDWVNKPFAQFETVVVNDGVDFDDIDRKYKNDLTTEDSEPIDDAPEDVVEEVPVAPVLETPVAVEEAPAAVEPAIEVVDASDEPAVEAQVVPLVSQVELADEEQETINQNTNEQNEEDMFDTDDELEVKVDEYGYPIIDRDENNRLKKKLKNKTRLVNALIAAIVALLLLGAGGFMYMNNIIKEKSNRIDHLVAQIKEEHHARPAMPPAGHRPADMRPGRPPHQANADNRRSAEQAAADHERKVKEHEIALKAEELKHQEAIKKAQEARRIEEARQAEQIRKEMERRKAEEAKQAAAKAAEAAKLAAAQKAAEAAKQAAAKKAAEAAAAKKAAEAAAAKKAAEAAAAKKTAATTNASYNDDPRVRTGAYVITGVSETVTVREGQTLASISKAYLGPGMECYVEAINGGIKTVQAGQKIKIPALKVKQAAKKKQ
ncbi:MAG: HU family DNA-binding protein [Prevotella sp.]|nr:HU family DNA-binding protein [Prevotella sp.]